MRLFAALALIALLWPFAAAGHPIECYQPDSVIEQLEQNYQERVEGSGPSKANELWQIWVSEDGTWTLVVLGSRITCIMAHGENWRWRPRGNETAL